MRTAAESTDPRIKPFEELANLSLARTFYSTGQYELATKYFDRVSQESYDWANSLFESSWANFMLKQQGYSKALGNIHTIQAPFFENYIKPESIGEGLTVKATIYFYNCLYDRAAGGDRRVQRHLPDGVHRAEEADRRHDREQPAVRRRGEDPQGDVGPARAGRARGARRPRRLELAQALPVRRGARQASSRPTTRPTPAWQSTSIAQTVFADLTLQRSLAVNEAGDLARRRIKRLTEELSQLIKRVIKIEFEILQGEKGELEHEVIEERERGAAAAGNKPIEDIRADDEHVIWPFVGEYWRDELGYYRVKIRNKCQRNAPEGAPATGEGAAPAAPAGGWRCTSRGWRRSDAVEPIRLEIRKGQCE